ncbi:hypothetical protein F4825DRAFT_454527 [Nemania diffusa]|nr:hypothetical protein F4825DRAFT_454527 [Nemania diffusa]
MDQQPAGSSAGPSSSHSLEITTKREVLRKLLQDYQDCKPMFCMEDIFKLQEHIRNLGAGDRQRWFVALRSLQSTIAAIDQNPFMAPHFHSEALQPGDPSSAGTNAAIHSLGPLRRDAEREYGQMKGSEIVTTLWNKARHSLDESHYFNNYFKPTLFMALVHVGRLVENIVCFQLGTFEADNHSPHTYYPESVACTAQHVFAFDLREHIASTYGQSPTLVFQHLEYTMDTARLLHGLRATVCRDNVTGFRYVNANSLVIWMCRDGHVPIPVKQIIADFMYQERPMTLPLAMIWPEEGIFPAVMEDIVMSSKINPETGKATFSATDNTPRTNKLHDNYRKHEIPPGLLEDPFRISPRLGIYTRKP